MTSLCQISPLAQQDLDDIWVYSTQTWGVEQAETYLRQIWQHVELIAAHPGLGQACPDIRAGYRKYKSGAHVLFYRSDKAGIVIIRILHERMDVTRHL